MLRRTVLEMKLKITKNFNVLREELFCFTNLPNRWLFAHDRLYFLREMRNVTYARRIVDAGKLGRS